MLALRSPRGEGGGWTVVPTSANFARQRITVNAPQIKEPGFVFVYLSYLSAEALAEVDENAGTTMVNFDDIRVTHTRNNIIQYNACQPKLQRRLEYYAFQQTTANSWTRENVTGNNFLGNGGTEINRTTQLYDLEYRHFDPLLGRMNGVDPMATKYASLTPYNYSFNDPVTFTDVNGADPNAGCQACAMGYMDPDSRGRNIGMAPLTMMDPGGGSWIWNPYTAGGYGMAGMGLAPMTGYGTGGMDAGWKPGDGRLFWSGAERIYRDAESVRRGQKTLTEYAADYGSEWWLVFANDNSLTEKSMYIYFDQAAIYRDFDNMLGPDGKLVYYGAYKHGNGAGYHGSLSRINDYKNLAALMLSNFGDQLSSKNSYAVSIDHDYRELNGKEGAKTFQPGSIIKTYIDPNIVREAGDQLKITVAHELFHKNDFDSGFRKMLLNEGRKRSLAGDPTWRNSGEVSPVHAILEVRAYNHSIEYSMKTLKLSDGSWLVRGQFEMLNKFKGLLPNGGAEFIY